ncbi:radical SAM family heme chaperone HemW [Candidatus Tokpelaia sp.]|uniref:radical SAM family heme chaperone HemW n=1 Tax=Candidatus Tokpelaia sp. TaxID=2233777 RepID=UPI0012391593|nr:radical SAM family heme chaperone HemW [Candidatus Tokpelaia sp.]KAA6405597.1 coproporphyrinogen III oxidase [Candidatus Tokpelaia sp.]
MAVEQEAAPFGIYIHWPFCAAKCPYCDFNSHVRRHAVDEPRFVAAFAREMAIMRERVGRRSVSSIFFGGGTPSLMQPQTVAALLDKIAALWPVAAEVEITLEANPSSVEAERFKAYRAAGVNRLSLGVQALDDMELQRLGRLHNVRQALAAIELARAAFPRLSFDLIYARPGQTEQAWKQELNRAIDLAADHLSLYQLTIEDGTVFQKLYQAGRLKLPSDAIAARLYAATQEVAAGRGLPAYEISNHAVPGCEARHNLLYWRYQDYIGLGAGAHGRFYETGRLNETGNSGAVPRRIATMAEKNPERWLERVEKRGTGIVEEEYLTAAEQADEMLLMGLRLSGGLDMQHYEAVAGRPLAQEKLADLQSLGLVEIRGNYFLCATAKGRLVLNRIITELAADK